MQDDFHSIRENYQLLTPWISILLLLFYFLKERYAKAKLLNEFDKMKDLKG